VWPVHLTGEEFSIADGGEDSLGFSFAEFIPPVLAQR
jgi:hypothetical protein